MSDATVVLEANDKISTPVLKAVAAMQQLQAALGDVVAAAKNTGPAAAAAGEGLKTLAAEAEAGAIPHRAAHQALALVSGQMAELAGAAPGAAGALHVVDSVLFQLAVTGGNVSLEFIGVVAAVVAITTALKMMHDASEKAKADFEETVSKLRAIAGATDQATSATLNHAKAILVDLEAQLKVAESTPTLGDKLKKLGQDYVTSFEAAGAAVSNMAKSMIDPTNALIKFGAATTSTMTAAGAAVSAADPKIKSLADQIAKLQGALSSAQTKMDPIKNSLTQLGAAFRELSDQYLEKASLAAEKDSAAITELGMKHNWTKAQIESFIQTADASGLSLQEYEKQAEESSKKISQVMGTMAVQVGEALGNLATQGSFDWRKLMANMLDATLQAVQQMVLAWMALQLMIQNYAGVAKGLLALAVIGAARGVVSSLAAGGPSSAAASAAASGTGSGSSAVSGAPGTVGGSSVSSANSIVNNYNSVSLGVEALDLSSVSDMQLRSLASRIGRVLSDAAGTGNFSLVGA